MSVKPYVQTSRYFYTFYLEPWLGPPLSTVAYVMYLSFVADVMCSHNGPCGMWHWLYLHERYYGASSQKFPVYFPRGTTLFDFVIVPSGSNLCTGSVSNDNMGDTAIGL